MTIQQLELLIELHRRIDLLVRRSPTFRVLAPGIVRLLRLIDATAEPKETTQ